MSKKLFVIVLPLLFLGCKENAPPEPPPYVRSIELEALDASCTEVWLKITLTQATTDSVVLTRNGQTLQTLRLTTADSILIDEGLLPNRSYLYKAYRLSGASVTDSSKAVQVTTMDTTSHNFTWQIDTLGDGGGSVLYDVAIINDTLAYAVGEIMVRDSVGNWINPPYNIAKWNGQRWELIRRLHDCRLYYPSCGPGYMLYAPARSIFAFGPNDIWVAVGTAQHWDGVRWTEHAGILGVGDANKIWGTSSSDLYFVGNNGFIAHYDGTSWRRIESGTRQYLQDVWGIVNQQSGERTVLCAASHPLGYGEKKILSINQSNNVDTLPWPSQRVVMSVWISKPSTFYTCGGGVFRRSIDQQWKEIAGANVIPTLTEKVRGTTDNDFFVAGDFGVVAHFNGVSFKLYPEASAARVYKSLDFKGNQMVAVGYTSSRGIVVRGMRN